MGSNVAIKIHELQDKIDSLCGGVGFARGHNVAFAHNRNRTFNDETAARIAIS